MAASDQIISRELTPCTVAGQRVRRFKLENSSGMSVELMEYGATLLSLRLTMDDNSTVQVNRGLRQPADYAKNVASMGATCGRYAGRISHGSFLLDAQHINLACNSGDHHLHGGATGFSTRLWRATPFVDADRKGVKFAYSSAAGEEGYPGRLDCLVSYSLDPASRLHLDYAATVHGQPTVVNLTNHCYWNLAATGDVLDHMLWLAGANVLEFDPAQIPTGARFAAAGTPFDFSIPRRLGEQMAKLPTDANGLDHCFVDPAMPTTADTSLEGLRKVAELRHPATGRGMVVFTDQPALVVYSANHLDGTASVGGHQQHDALCLECQQYPDAPNQPLFPSTVLRPGDAYRQKTVYQFYQFYQGPDRVLSASG